MRRDRVGWILVPPHEHKCGLRENTATDPCSQCGIRILICLSHFSCPLRRNDGHYRSPRPTKPSIDAGPFSFLEGTDQQTKYSPWAADLLISAWIVSLGFWAGPRTMR